MFASKPQYFIFIDAQFSPNCHYEYSCVLKVNFSRDFLFKLRLPTFESTYLSGLKLLITVAKSVYLKTCVLVKLDLFISKKSESEYNVLNLFKHFKY